MRREEFRVRAERGLGFGLDFDLLDFGDLDSLILFNLFLFSFFVLMGRLVSEGLRG